MALVGASLLLLACASIQPHGRPRAERERTTCDAPALALPTRDLQPMSLRYQGSFTVSGQSMPITSTLVVTDHPAGGWAVVERAVLPRGAAVDSARLDARSLAPRERMIQQGPMKIALQFADTLATGTIATAAETHAIAAQLCGTLFGDGAGAFLVVGRLPLAPGYRTALQHLDVRGARVTRKELKVLGSERVTVPGGNFDAWKVALRDEGSPAPTTVWVDKASLVPVRFSSVQGPVTVTQELERRVPL